MIKWEESKKWQKTVEKMKLRLKDKEEENERILKANKVFKDQFDRYENNCLALMFVMPYSVLYRIFNFMIQQDKSYN